MSYNTPDLANVLNRQITGSYRRNKISLNAPIPSRLSHIADQVKGTGLEDVDAFSQQQNGQIEEGSTSGLGGQEGAGGTGLGGSGMSGWDRIIQQQQQQQQQQQDFQAPQPPSVGSIDGTVQSPSGDVFKHSDQIAKSLPPSASSRRKGKGKEILSAVESATAPAPTSAAAATATASPLKRPRQSTTSASTSTRRKTTSSLLSSSYSTNKSPPDPTKYPPPPTRLKDLGGLTEPIERLLELVALPLCHPEIYLHTGVRPPRGVLLAGPPGCGKTMLAGALAGELGLPFINVSAPSIVSGMSGESEKTIRETFEEAASLAPCILFIDEIDAITPKRETAQREMERRIVAQLLTCMDDLSWEKTENRPVMIIGATNRPDSLDPALRRAGRFDHEISMGVPDELGREQILRTILSNLRLSGDFDFKKLAKETPGYVGADLSALAAAAGVVAVKRIFKELGDATPPLEPSTTDMAVVAEVGDQGMTAGSAEVVQRVREENEMVIDDDITLLASPPISNSQQAPMTIPDSVVVSNVANLDLSLSTDRFKTLPPSLISLPISSFLLNHSTALTPTQLLPLLITSPDFAEALTQIQPSSKREGFTTVPDITWSQIGALTQIREELRMSIVQPIKRPEVFERLGIRNPCGVLLWGPPGCGKTLLAKAVANESRANFISVKGPELLNKYVGESERSVRQLFARARASSPCIVFFDELDALVPRRDDTLSEASSRVVNTLLTELDGLEPRKQVFVISATNRPDMIDPAMVRPGRLDKLLYVDLPGPQEREEILRALIYGGGGKDTRKKAKVPIDENDPGLDLGRLVRDRRCENFSGADLNSLIREAATLAIKEVFSQTGEFGPGGDQDVDEVEDDEESKARKEVREMEMEEEVKIRSRHLEMALSKISPSVSSQQRRKYEILRSKFAGQPFGKKAAVLDESVSVAEVVVDKEAPGRKDDSEGPGSMES